MLLDYFTDVLQFGWLRMLELHVPDLATSRQKGSRQKGSAWRTSASLMSEHNSGSIAGSASLTVSSGTTGTLWPKEHTIRLSAVPLSTPSYPTSA